ncbi:MAG: hypothetical protein U0263_39345 [Polyangiaceae bacterium]
MLKSSWKWLVALGAVFVPASLLAAVNIPNSFTAGTPIKAADMNANFSAIKTFVDGLETAIGTKANKPATGAFANTPQGRIAYAWVDGSCAASATPNCALQSTYSYNPAGAGPTSTRTGAGIYAVTFPSLSATAGGHVQVTAYGGQGTPTSNHCNILFWGDTTANVRCYTSAGAAADTAFTILWVY